MKIIILFSIIVLTKSQQSRLNMKNIRQLQTKDSTLAESPSYYLLEPNGPGTYAFGYELDDLSSGNVQFRDEEKLLNGTVRGTYGHMRSDGLMSITKYVSDENGFRSETQNFKSGEQPSKNDNKSIRHPLDHSATSSDANMESEKNLQTENQDENGEMTSTVIDGVQPVAVMTKNGSGKFGLQLINNFVPANFPIITFNPRPAEKDSGKQENYDQYDYVDFHNDKFHNPLTDVNGKKSILQKMTKIASDVMRMADTREALWYKEFIRNRRKEFLKRYAYQGRF